MKLSSNKTYILPTKIGLALIFVVFLVFIIAITFGHPFSYFITFFSISIIVVCAFSTNSEISKMTHFQFKDVFQEAGTEGTFLFEASKKEVGSPKVIETKVENSKAVKKSTLTENYLQIRGVICAKKCSISKIPRVRISTTYPLGIFRAWKYIDSKSDLIVFPKRIEAGKDFYGSSFIHSDSLSIGQKSETKDEFLDHRLFRESDSWKHIDWKAFARGKGLLTKNFSGKVGDVITLEVFRGDSLESLGVVTSKLFNCCEKSRPSVLICDGDIVSRGSGKNHLHNCLRFLSRMGECSE